MSRRTVALAGVASLALAVGLVAVLRWDLGVGPDGSAYLVAARSLAAGDGLRAQGEPMTHFPPLYPALLALVGPGEGPSTGGALPLQGFLYGATALALALVVGRALPPGRRTPGVAVAVVLFATSGAFFRLFTQVLSEGLFLLALVGALGALAETDGPRRRWWSAACGGALAAAFLTRYSALGVMPGFALAVAWGVPASGRGPGSAAASGRWWAAAGVALLALAPGAAWVLRNRWLTGTAVDRVVSFHPPGLAHVAQAGEAASMFVWGHAWGIPRSLAAVALLVALVWGARVGARESRRVAALCRACAVVGVGYLLFLWFSLSIVDAHTPLDLRILSPVLLLLVVVASLTLPTVAANATRGRRRVLLGIALVVVCVRGVWMAADARWLFRHGAMYTSPAWRSAPVVPAVAALPAGVRVVSDGADALEFLTGRTVAWLPRRYEAASLRVNPALDTELGDLCASLLRGDAVLVDFAAIGRDYFVDADVLAERCPDVPLSTVEGATVLGRGMPPQAPPG